MKRNYIILVIVAAVWVVLILLVFNIIGERGQKGAKEETPERTFDIDKAGGHTRTAFQSERKKPEPIIAEPSSLPVAEPPLPDTMESTSVMPELKEEITQKESTSQVTTSQKQEQISLPDRASILKENIEFLRFGSKSAAQVRIRAYEYHKMAEKYREMSEELSTKGADPEVVEEVSSAATFFDSLSLRLQRTQGVKSRMRRLASELESAMPFVR